MNKKLLFGLLFFTALVLAGQTNTTASVTLLTTNDLDCWFDPIYQEPTNLRYVYCNYTNSDNDPILGATITHETFDTNDWFAGEYTTTNDEQGKIIGYHNVQNISDNDINFSNTYKITNTTRAHIRFGSWQFPQETKQMWTSIWLKAGSTATQFRTMVCNGTYADEVMDNTPFYYNRTANYNNCTLANVTDLNKTIINYNNWTRLDIDITDAYNSVAGIQEGQQNFSVHFSTYDDFEINATGWSISSIWLPPNYNETKSAYNFSSTSLFQTPYPDNQEDDSDDSGINMTGNVLLFSLNESSGNIVDYSGNGHTGTAQGTLAYSQGGQVDKSLYWDGDSGTRIDVADDSSLDLQTEMTLMFWIYQENPSDQPDWITKGVYYESYATWGDTSATYFVTNGNSLAGSAVPSEEWHHVAFIKNSSGRYFYIDGELDTSDTYTTNTELVSDPLYFSSSSYPFEGKMDEIALFDRSLSTSEVENVYNKQLKKFMPYSEMSYPDNGNYTTFYNNDNYLEFYGDSDYSADGDYLHFNADNAEYAIMKNVSMFDGLEQSDLTACVFFKRDDMSYSNHERLFSFSNHLRLSLTPNTGATTGHNVQCRIRTDEGGVVVAGTTNEPINDTVWHHACCVRDTENEIIHLILDGDDVDEQTVAEANNLSAISQGFFGSDTANIGGGNHFNGTLAHFFFHNDSHTLTEIAQGIDSSYWMYAVSDDSWTESDVYARGSWHNDTHYSWDEIGDYAPVMYLKYWNQISNMTYNATNELYYDIYNTSQDQMATTQNSEGVNYTAFFNASHPNYESKNESEYYYVKGVSTANCSVEIGWNNASETGQYQLARINWTYTSNIPFTTKKVVFCENGESGEECYEYSGNALTFHHRMKNYGEATVYCEVQNDFMTESFVNYTPDNLTVGCWSAYGHYDGTKGSLELESDLHVCSGTHQMISMLDDSVLKNPGTGYAMSLEGPTIFDGGNSRGTHSTDSDYRTMLWGYDLEDKQQNPNGNLKIQNGDIGFLFAGNLTDSYFANYEFENMSIAFRLEDTIGNNFSIINNTFINTGIDKGSSIWTSGQNLTLQFNDFSDLNSTAVGHVVCSGCSNTVLEQNYYSDVGDLEIYVTTTRNIDTQIGSMGCEVGTWGAQHPYSNSTTYTNNASIFGEIYDEYPCTTRSVCGTITEDVTLEADLNVSTSGYCFVIGADDITIDCDGYTVIRVSSGAGSPFINDGAYDGLTLKNCFVQNFPAVVYIGGDYASSINNTFYNITNQAIALSGGKYYSSHSNNISYSGTGINAWGSVYSITIWNETWHDNDRAFYLRGFLNGLVVGESTFDNTVLIEDLPVNSYVKARFVNTTYTGSIDFTDDDSELDVEWYVDVLVQDTSSVALPGAAVEAYDNTTANIFSDVTELDGYIDPTRNVTEKMINSTGTTSYTDHNFTASLMGYNSNYTEQSITQQSTVIINLTGSPPPTIIHISPASGSWSNGTFYPTCRAIDDGLDFIALYIDGSWNQSNSTACSGCDTTFEVEGLMAGSHDWICYAYDQSSQGTWADSNWTIQADLTDPTGEITSPLNNTRVNGVVPITATVSDVGSGVASVNYSIYNVSGSSWNYSACIETVAPYTCEWDSVTGTISTENYTVWIQITDNAGLINSSTENFTYQIDKAMSTLQEFSVDYPGTQTYADIGDVIEFFVNSTDSAGAGILNVSADFGGTGLTCSELVSNYLNFTLLEGGQGSYEEGKWNATCTVTGGGGNHYPIADVWDSATPDKNRNYGFTWAVEVGATCGDVTADMMLTGNVSSAGNCFNITTNNLTINCDGYSIIGDDTGFGFYSQSDGTPHDNLTLKNCNVWNFATPYSLQSSSTNITFTNNTAENTASFATCLDFDSQNNLNISYNDFDKTVSFWNSENVSFHNNTREGFFFHGLSTYNIDNLKIYNNVFSDSATFSIGVYDNCDNVNISYNEINDASIFTTSALNVTFHDNNIIASSGILVRSDNTTVRDNIIVAETCLSAMSSSIISPVSDLIFMDNTCTATVSGQGVGLTLSYSSDVNSSYNTFTNFEYGFASYATNDITLQDIYTNVDVDGHVAELNSGGTYYGESYNITFVNMSVSTITTSNNSNATTEYLNRLRVINLDGSGIASAGLNTTLYSNWNGTSYPNFTVDANGYADDTWVFGKELTYENSEQTINNSFVAYKTGYVTNSTTLPAVENDDREIILLSSELFYGYNVTPTTPQERTDASVITNFSINWWDWTNNVSTVLLECDSVEYTALLSEGNKTNGTWYYAFTGWSVGEHDCRWKANNTLNAWNQTNLFTHVMTAFEEEEEDDSGSGTGGTIVDTDFNETKIIAFRIYPSVIDETQVTAKLFNTSFTGCETYVVQNLLNGIIIVNKDSKVSMDGNIEVYSTFGDELILQPLSNSSLVVCADVKEYSDYSFVGQLNFTSSNHSRIMLNVIPFNVTTHELTLVEEIIHNLDEVVKEPDDFVDKLKIWLVSDLFVSDKEFEEELIVVKVWHGILLFLSVVLVVVAYNRSDDEE